MPPCGKYLRQLPSHKLPAADGILVPFRRLPDFIFSRTYPFLRKYLILQAYFLFLEYFSSMLSKLPAIGYPSKTLYPALLRFQLPCQQSKQGTFSGSVCADNTDPISRIDFQFFHIQNNSFSINLFYVFSLQ